MKTEEKIKIMQDYDRGIIIERSSNNFLKVWNKWELVNNPNFNFEKYKYRVAPHPNLKDNKVYIYRIGNQKKLGMYLRESDGFINNFTPTEDGLYLESDNAFSCFDIKLIK